MPLPKLTLSGPELDAALCLLKEHGVSDVLPPLLEVSALETSWNETRPILEGIDLSERFVGRALTLVSPKQRYLFRPVHLLDPVDALLYTALVRRVAPAIESKRLPIADGRVFSYRFSAAGADDFQLTNDWPGFVERIKGLAPEHEFVARADITDFFPNVYLHRLSNAIDAMTGKNAETLHLENMLKRWSPDGSSTSYGVPVGIVTSNFLAEALLNHIDHALVAKNFEFVQYVDDYYIFTESENRAREALGLLAERLILHERLNVNPQKTRITPAAILAEELAAPDATTAIRDRFVTLVLGGDPYAEVEPESLDAEQEAVLEEIDAVERLKIAIAKEPIDFPEVALALHALRATRDASGLPIVVGNLPALAAASKQVGMYLADLVSLGPQTIHPIAGKILDYVESAEYKSVFQIIWLLHPLTVAGGWDHEPRLLTLAATHVHELVRRQAVLALGQSPERDYVIDVKLALTDSSGWVKRAALVAARALPDDERKHIWSSAKRQLTIDNCLDQAVLRYASS